MPDAATESDVPDGAQGGDDDAYGGVLGAYPYAFRTSDSRLFRTFVVVGGLLSALVVVAFALAIVTLIGGSAGVPGGTFTFSRAFFVFLMLLVLAPLVSPVLLVARRHRRTGSTLRYDRGLALAGYLFVAALYVGLVISTPASLADDPSGPLAPVVAWLYALPRAAGAVPPVFAALLVYVAHRRLR